MNRRRVLAVSFGATIGVVCGLLFWFSQPSEVQTAFGGRQGVATIANFDAAEAYRIGPMLKDVQFAEASVADFPVVAGPVAIPRGIAAEIAHTLLDEKTHLHLYKACEPTPGVRLSFVRGGDRIDVILCFECNMAFTYIDQRFIYGFDFDEVRPVFVRAVKACFPDDEVVQRLTESP